MDTEGADILDQPAQPSDKPRITTKYMTKYERARILGTRALQIRYALILNHELSSHCPGYLWRSLDHVSISYSYLPAWAVLRIARSGS